MSLIIIFCLVIATNIDYIVISCQIFDKFRFGNRLDYNILLYKELL